MSTCDFPREHRHGRFPIIVPPSPSRRDGDPWSSSGKVKGPTLTQNRQRYVSLP